MDPLKWCGWLRGFCNVVGTGRGLGYSASGGEQGSLDSARGVYGDGWSMTQIEGAEGREPLFGGGGVMDTSRD